MNTDTIHDALARAQGKIRNPRLDGVNPHFRSRYATLGACIDAVRGPLAEVGVSLSHDASVSDGVLTVATVLSRGSETLRLSAISVPAPGKVQELGSAVTYLRRYSLCAALSIVGEDDDDGNAAQAAQTAKPQERQQRPNADACSLALRGAGCKTAGDAEAVSMYLMRNPTPSAAEDREALARAVEQWAAEHQGVDLVKTARDWSRKEGA